MLRLIVLCLFVWLPPAVLAQSPSDDFDARPISSRDIRSLQAALALAGSYTGLIDGAWGRGSQSALEDFVAGRGRSLPPTYRDAGVLLDLLETEFGKNGWAQLGPDDGPLTLLVPYGLLARSVEDDGHITLETASRDLLVRVIGGTGDNMIDMHVWLEQNHDGPTEFYRLVKDDTVISAGKLDTGKSAYLRSAAYADGWISVLIQAEPVHRNRAMLMAATLRSGAQPSVSARPDGRLRRILRGGRENSVRAQPPVPAVPDPSPVRSSGTAFYINNTDLVTAEHVVGDCGEIRLSDGTAIQIVATDAAADLAIVTALKRSPVWLSIDPRAAPVLGERTFALGYPYLGRFDQGLSVTGGNISALPASGDPKAPLTISAPVQPGNSGGPLLNRRGDVVGVVVARANDIATLVDEGSLPQNVNFATPVAALRRFLDRHRVFFVPQPSETVDLDAGLPDAMQRAVVTVFCH